ncbi:hypothetical protein E2C05_22185, partial [Paracraurococcus ruber]
MQAAQNASPTGHGNLIVQIVGDGNTVLDPGRPWLVLRTYTSEFWTKPATGEAGSPGFTAQGQQETELLSPFTRSFTLQGRDALFERLRGWLQGS